MHLPLAAWVLLANAALAPDAGVDGGTVTDPVQALAAADASAPDAGPTPRSAPSVRPAPPRPDVGSAPPAPDEARRRSPAPPASTSALPAPAEPTVYGAVELEALVLPSGPPGGALDGFAVVTPLLGLQLGDGRFAAELGPPLRLRLLDGAPLQRDGDLGGVLRGEDWDTLSDLGALVRRLSLGGEGDPVRVRLGALDQRTLGQGHLVARFSNRDDPGRHPAGATAAVELGPARVGLLASDVLSARVVAGELGWDLGRTLSRDEALADRVFLTLAAGADFAQRGVVFARPGCADPCGGPDAPGATLGTFDASWVLVRSRGLRLMLEGGAGLRFAAQKDLGLALGLAADGELGPVALSGRLEARRVGGGFRFGYFGPLYDVARFSGVGLHEAPLALEALPPGGAVALEVRAAVGAAVTFAAAVEAFATGRVDADGRLTLALLDERLFASARTVLWGLGAAPRVHVAGELRWRLAPSVYVLGSGGTVFVPQADGSLVRGVTASVGAGVDFAH